MQHPPSAEKANISEIFSSLQGEGTHLGAKQIFVRFEECHIHCTYCDEDKPGKVMTVEQVLETVRSLEKTEGPHASVSLTGGEPLLYTVFLKNLLPALKKEGLKIYLETNGILWRALPEVLDLCDIIAMDMKPASVTGEKNFYEDHERFLEICREKETFIKIVVSKSLKLEEFDRLAEIIRKVAPKTPLILMPVSADIEGHEDPELMALLYGLQRSASRSGLDVRIVPRFHKILKIR